MVLAIPKTPMGCPVHAVLQSADQSASDHAGNGPRRATAKKMVTSSGKSRIVNRTDSQKNLEKDGHYRNADGNWPAKPMYLNFLAGSQ